ncbi:unnamed protein product [Mytilus coruscus]|uniref:CCHC-type domain-containing protein n=1 Tax=Mytilus coruscus TaxID=42192 RepID=A0A6J8ASI3_MYTCO|nr:unnamed protein product [Mytilus coruscus]
MQVRFDEKVVCQGKFCCQCSHIWQKKNKRGANWTTDEELALIDQENLREDSLFGKMKGCGDVKIATIRQNAWKEICDISNASSNRKTSNQLFKIQQHDQESGHQYLTRIQKLSVGAAELPESVIIQLAINGMSQNLKPHVVSHDPKTSDELRRSVEIANNVINCKPHQTQNNYCSHNFNNSCCHSHNNSSNMSANDITQLCSSLSQSFKSVVRQEVMSMQPKPQYQGRQQYERREQRQGDRCRRCGKFCKIRRQCQAFKVKCFHCDRIDHYKEVCEQKMRESQNTHPFGNGR